MSQITTHILDTSLGKPAAGVAVHLQQCTGHSWETIASGITNADGRIPGLLPEDILLSPGIYRIRFEVDPYFEALKTKSFYPQVEIEFRVTDGSHYHVPLLLNPFGYSTYRGS